MDYAVIRTGGKQYRVSPGETIQVEKLTAEPGGEYAFTDVLLTSTAGDVRVGAPTVSGARVTARVLAQGKAKKVIVFKKKRRKGYRRQRGHRQPITTLQVTGIDLEQGAHGTQEGTGE